MLIVLNSRPIFSPLVQHGLICYVCFMRSRTKHHLAYCIDSRWYN